MNTSDVVVGGYYKLWNRQVYKVKFVGWNGGIIYANCDVFNLFGVKQAPQVRSIESLSKGQRVKPRYE